jgi:hypothetical protein
LAAAEQVQQQITSKAQMAKIRFLVRLLQAKAAAEAQVTPAGQKTELLVVQQMATAAAVVEIPAVQVGQVMGQDLQVATA